MFFCVSRSDLKQTNDHKFILCRKYLVHAYYVPGAKLDPTEYFQNIKWGITGGVAKFFSPWLGPVLSWEQVLHAQGSGFPVLREQM